MSTPPQNTNLSLVTGDGGAHSFKDPRAAALFLLTTHDIPLLEFLSWALRERSLVLNKPAAFTTQMWKFLLLQDHSLTHLKEQLELAAAGAKCLAPPAVGRAAVDDITTPPTTASLESVVTYVKRPCAKRQQPASAATSGTRKRGSNRRIPERENVTDCPECGRKGQSIFDPSISDKEGHVWQYFYCRNSMCAKGRSCNRYIGWAIRPLD